jgi:MFS transporter, DHA1 family, multidrug resistance protein
VAGVALGAVALGLMGFVHGVAAYSVLAFLIGFCSGISFPGLKNILSRFPGQNRPKAFSTFQMACQVGAFGGALVGGLFVGVDLRILFTVVFALCLAYCLVAVLLIPTELTDQPSVAPDRAPLFNGGVLKGLQIGRSARYFLLSSVFWFLSITFLVGIPLHMQAFVPQWAPSAPFWITGIILLLLQVPALRFMTEHFRPGQVMAFAFAAMTIAYLTFGAGRTAWWVVLGCFVVVFGDILFTPTFDLWVTKKIPSEQLAKAMGAMHFFRSFGNLVGTLVAGLLFDLAHRTGIPGLNWYVAAVVAAGCALFSLASAHWEPGMSSSGVVQPVLSAQRDWD